MSIGADWPISIMATQDVACGARLWNTGGQLRATLIVKATFTLVDGGPMRLVSPAPLATVDEHAGGDPNRSLVVPSDVVPYRPRGEVLFVGHAHAPNGQPCPSLTARLAVHGQKPLVDKAIHVYGERVVLDDGQTSQPVPFTRVPVVYERTTASPEENPIGMGREPGSPAPNLVDPVDPSSPAGFGAIPPHWPVRRRMLRALDPVAVEAAVPEIPAAFAWSYFQAAPPDQRCVFFEGGEWLVLDGLHPDKAHFQSQLPGARAAARLYTSSAMTSYREFPLVADTLFIDGDRGLVCVVWRGNLDVDPAMVSQVQALAGLELPGRPIPWPQTSVLLEPPPPVPPSTREGPARSPSMAGIPAAGRSPSTSGMPAVQQPAAPQQPGQSTSGMPAVQQPVAQQAVAQQAVAQQAVAQQAVAQQAVMPHQPGQSTSGMPAVQQPQAAAPPPAMHVGRQSTSSMPAVQVPAQMSAQMSAQAPTPVPGSPREPSSPVLASPLPASPHPATPPNHLAQTAASPMDMQQAIAAAQRGAPATLLGTSNHAVLAAASQMPVVPVVSPPPVAPSQGPHGQPGEAPQAADPAATVPVAPDVLRAALRASMASPQSARTVDAPPGVPLEALDRDEPNTRIVSAAAIESLLASPMSEPGAVTVQRPAAAAPGPESLNPSTMKRPRFDDPETFQPDSESIARIVQEAEAQLGSARQPEPIDTRGPPAVPSPAIPLSHVPTPSPMVGIESATEAERIALVARARADAAAAEGAALAREHISAGAMRKVRPPRTTIRGLSDPARVPEPAVHDEDTNRPATQRYDSPTSTQPGGHKLAELLQKAQRGDFPPLDEPAPTRQFETSALQAALGALESASPAEPGATHTAISPVFPVRTVPDPEAPSERKRPISSPPERMSITNAIDMSSLLRDEVQRRARSGESLAGMSLEGVDLAGFDLAGRDLSGARMRGASLRNAKLQGANLSGAILDEADLTHAALDGANLSRASLRSAIVNDATLQRVDATEASFEGAIGTSAALEGLSAERALFMGARFDCARFDGAKLAGADFTEAIIDGASFDGAHLVEARLYEARAEAASFVRAVLTGARLDSSVLVRGRFQGIDAADSLWDQAELDQATFEGAKLAGASFTKTSCRETVFSSADLAEVRFNRSILWGARFVNVDMGTANFDGADTRGAVFSQGSVPPQGAGPSVAPGPTGRPPGG